jgi:hypothetical protein
VSPDLTEKLVLLVVTAALSGFTIPFVLKQVENRRARELKDRDAALVRQGKIIDAQEQTLNELSKLLWDWRYSAMRVTYYGSLGDTARFDAARDSYTDEVWRLLSQIRFHTSRTRWLIAAQTYDRLAAFYLEMVGFDKVLFETASGSDPVRRRLELGDLNRRIFDDVSSRIDALLYDIAIDVKLAARFPDRMQ